MLKKVRKKKWLGGEKMRGKIKEKKMEEGKGWSPQAAGH